MDDDITKMFEVKERLMRHMAWKQTPEQRLEAMMRLQRFAHDFMPKNSAGYHNFIRRNYRDRAARQRLANGG